MEKFPKKYGEPCSQQVNLPQFSFNYRQSKANLVKYLQFTPIFLKNSVFLSQIYPFFAQIYEKFSGFDGFKKIKLAMHTICHLFSTLCKFVYAGQHRTGWSLHLFWLSLYSTTTTTTTKSQPVVISTKTFHIYVTFTFILSSHFHFPG